jgi:hypothetical protein
MDLVLSIIGTLIWAYSDKLLSYFYNNYVILACGLALFPHLS